MYTVYFLNKYPGVKELTLFLTRESIDYFFIEMDSDFYLSEDEFFDKLFNRWLNGFDDIMKYYEHSFEFEKFINVKNNQENECFLQSLKKSWIAFLKFAGPEVPGYHLCCPPPFFSIEIVPPNWREYIYFNEEWYRYFYTNIASDTFKKLSLDMYLLNYNYFINNFLFSQKEKFDLDGLQSWFNFIIYMTRLEYRFNDDNFESLKLKYKIYSEVSSE